ncbi:MAG: hypothetical protein HYY05_01790 [Chloroflexi bacterium]|nr:hypothetical protein [Chloroflexota bacterium]
MSNERLQELEDEVKLLKNEIKQTLLDIQEHLLTMPAASPGASPPLPPPGDAAPATQPPASADSTSPEWAAEPEPGEPEPASASIATSREAASLDKTESPAGLPPNGTPPGPANGSTVTSPDLRTVARLTQWVGSTVSAIGQERMSAILELFELLEQIPEPISRALLGFARLEAGSVEGGPTARGESLAALLELNGLLSTQPNGHHNRPFSPAWGKEARHR